MSDISSDHEVIKNYNVMIPFSEWESIFIDCLSNDDKEVSLERFLEKKTIRDGKP